MEPVEDDLKQDLFDLLEDLRVLRDAAGRGEKARRLSVLITDLEKADAYLLSYVIPLLYTGE